MRVTGGRARGITLISGSSSDIRPATDRMREAVFSSLGQQVEGARFTDLFAGSGAYGLEALSRGADGGLFIEQNRRTAAALLKNLQAVCKSMQMEASSCCTVESRDVFGWTPPNEGLDLLFVDPPYSILPAKAYAIFELAAKSLRRDGTLIFEMPGELELLHPAFEMKRRLGKGKNQPTVALYRKRETQ